MSNKSKYTILNKKITEDVIESWQKTVDLMAEIMNVPAGLLMRVHHDTIEVFIKSQNEDNVYETGETAKLDTGLYCETVMDTKDTLIVPDALADPNWDNNPDIALGMISYMGMPILWPEGEIFGTICVLDSKYNRYTQQQQLLLEQFRMAVESSLAVVYNQEKLYREQLLQSKIISLSDLITNIAHQWRQPLNSITTAAATMKFSMELEEKVSYENITKFTDSIISESLYLSNIIEDFNTVFHSGVKSIESLSLSSIFDIVAQNARIVLEENSIKYISIIEEDVHIYANETVLTNIFSSIFNNAFESILLNDIKKNKRYFFLTLKKQDHYVEISLKDSGNGVKEEHLERIFEPYYTTKFKERGKGLSLYIVYLIVTNHLNGSVKLQNTQFDYQGKSLSGAEVIIELPLENH